MAPDDLDLARSIFKSPAVPLFENRVKREVLFQLEKLAHVSTQEDRWGNIVVRYEHRTKGLQPICFVGHMDHPGVVVENGKAYLKGGVQASYLPEAKVIFYDKTGNSCLGKGSILKTDFNQETSRLVMTSIPLQAAFGVWDLPDFQIKKGTIIGRACDDLVAVVSMVSLIRYLSLNKIPANVELWLTRAEEVGFWGTFGRLQEAKPDPNRVVISIEASNAKGFAVFGGGVVVRVGDRSSVFNSKVTRWLTHHSEVLRKESSEFTSQRLLMGGGSCEATPIQEAGFLTGALCLPLKNYHNHGSRGKLAPEMVSQKDWDSLMSLMVRIATSKVTLDQVHKKFSTGLHRRRAEALKNLRKRD